MDLIACDDFYCLIINVLVCCFSFCQAAAAAQAGASVIQIFTGRIRVISFTSS